MESTDRFSLPLLVAGQAQKELFHNEALLTLDTLVAGAVEEPPRNDPPDPPLVGTCYLVGSAPTAAWDQHADHLAAFTTGGWRFIQPVVGMSVLVKSEGILASFGSNGWEAGIIRGERMLVDGVQVVGAQGAAVPDPTGGITIDDEARAAIAQLLAVLRQHGLIST
ncbi:MAG TPA: DUF2793 domain-containing protein [Sphingomicrobium sp.]|nr:DUF2793 domain-containing protein [Sphingomicrobium sp.]